VREICHTVIVPGPNTCNLQASFTITPLNATANAFHFENTSTPLTATDSIRWTFGDGTSSNQVSPNHTYAQPGTYNVCLRIQKRNSNGTLSNCVREICHTVFVPGPNVCNLVANFHFYRIPSSGTALPFLYHFVNTTTPLASTDSIRWKFGDGGTSNQVNPNHAYAQPGTYTVCLRVIKRTSAGVLTNCVSEVCHTLVVTAPNPTACNLQPYPNPVGNTVSVNVFLAVPQMIDVYVYNTSNILVKEKHQPGVTGNNIVTLVTSDLFPGIYIMKVVRGNSVCYTTFIKL
jgi:chitodextrinase